MKAKQVLIFVILISSVSSSLAGDFSYYGNLQKMQQQQNAFQQQTQLNMYESQMQLDAYSNRAQQYQPPIYEAPTINIYTPPANCFQGLSGWVCN